MGSWTLYDIYHWSGQGQGLFLFDMEKRYTWNEDYNTGVKFIDEQHQYFFNIVSTLKENLNALISALHKAKPSAAKGTYIGRITLSTTMGPGIGVDSTTL